MKKLQEVKKPWGKTYCAFRDATHEVWYAEIRKGGFSSEHYHLAKTNEFYVMRGTLLVHVWDQSKRITTHTLTEGCVLSVEPFTMHQFEALTNVKLMEVYYGRIEGEDIFRGSPGGRNKPKKE